MRLQLQVFAQRPELGAVNTKYFDWPVARYPQVVTTDLLASIIPVTWSKLIVLNFLTTSSIVVRRGVLKAVGLFDTQLQGPEDFDLWLRIAEVTTFGHMNVPLTGYRDVPGSVSKQVDRMIRDKYKMLRKLDRRSAWHHRRLLRRKAYSFANYSGFHAYGEAGRQGAALLCVCRSLLWYPLPYSRTDTTASFPRAKGLVLALLRCAGLRKPPSRTSRRPADHAINVSPPAVANGVAGTTRAAVAEVR
jgi:hypothetical protein